MVDIWFSYGFPQFFLKSGVFLYCQQEHGVDIHAACGQKLQAWLDSLICSAVTWGETQGSNFE